MFCLIEINSSLTCFRYYTAAENLLNSSEKYFFWKTKRYL